jgi:hypothetical protein
MIAGAVVLYGGIHAALGSEEIHGVRRMLGRRLGPPSSPGGRSPR